MRAVARAEKNTLDKARLNMEKIKILMVDDEEKFRETTAKILSRKGYETTVAGSGAEALEILKKKPQDVVVLDIKMPGMDGHEALARMKELDPKIQVIMLTGHGAMDSARESLKHGAFEYLSKPCDIDLLALRINDAYSAMHKGKKEEKQVRDVMIPIEEYTTVGPEKTVREGIQMLRQSFEVSVPTSRLMKMGHRSILVMDRKGELLGVLSIMDLIRSVRPSYLSAPKPSMADSIQYSAMFWSGLFTRQAKALALVKIVDIMSPSPPVIREDANLMEAANLLFTERSRRLVVLGLEGKVIGVVREQEIFFELAGIILEA